MLGTIFASFLNATVYRVEKEYKYPTIFTLSSHCEKCKNPLSWYELVPVLGYLIVKGRCKKCGDKINLYYPISEFVLGLIFAFLYILSLPYYIWIVSLFLFVLSSYDSKYRGIPRNITHVFVLLCLIFFILYIQQYSNIYLPLATFVSLLVLNMVKKSFGFGDLLVILSLGLFLSMQQYVVMFLGGISFALIYSMRYILDKKVNYKKVKIPMIPFFSLAFLLAYTYGEQLYEYLLKLMGIW